MFIIFIVIVNIEMSFKIMSFSVIESILIFVGNKFIYNYVDKVK